MTPVDYPFERQSRRPSWVAGTAILMANGEHWHLPPISDALLAADHDAFRYIQDFARHAVAFKANPGGLDGECTQDGIDSLREGLARLLLLQYHTTLRCLRHHLRQINRDNPGDVIPRYLAELHAWLVDARLRADALADSAAWN